MKNYIPGISITLDQIEIGNVWRVIDKGSTKTCFYVMEITNTGHIWGIKFSPNTNGFTYCTIMLDCFLTCEGWLENDEDYPLVENMQSSINTIFLGITDFYFNEEDTK